MKIYVACGLTHVPRNHFTEYTQFIHLIAQNLKSLDSVDDVKYALVNSDPQLADKPFSERARYCYLWDRRMVEEADLVIAEASFPSTGMGIELQLADTAGIPVILCFRDYDGNKIDEVQYENPDHSLHLLQIGEGYISLMALGMPNVRSVIKYQDERDGVSQILQAAKFL
ncbi:hypothetical protein [Phyllobacterium endophyticum]|nr:hypothetical protein [Phyllobacterium endophyticum]MBB3236136.1 hypothetical protein [Phyllobacterium endophyticum]TYR41436.1 hypothetical protein FY050_09100 [Phyllobacterium endophyticum]